MPRRTRLVAFGSAGALVVAGLLCGVLVGGLAGQVLAIALISFGLGGALLLLFLEVGLSEDRDRAREDRDRAREERARRRRRSPPPRHVPRSGWRRRS